MPFILPNMWEVALMQLKLEFNKNIENYYEYIIVAPQFRGLKIV